MNPVWIPTPSPRTHAMASQVELFAPADEDCSNADTSRTAEHWEKALKAVMLDALLDEHPAQRLMNLAALVPAHGLQAWHLVAHTLLARRLDAAGSPADMRSTGVSRVAYNAHTVAWVLQRQWQSPVLADRWQRLLERLSPAQCRHLVRMARQRQRTH